MVTLLFTGRYRHVHHDIGTCMGADGAFPPVSEEFLLALSCAQVVPEDEGRKFEKSLRFWSRPEIMIRPLTCEKVKGREEWVFVMLLQKEG